MKGNVLFSFSIIDQGRAAGRITVNKIEIPFEITNVSNPLFDLLKGMGSMIFEPSHIWGEDNFSMIDWYCDEYGLKWILTTENGTDLNVKLSQVNDIFDDSSGKIVMNENCSFTVFYLAVIQELDRFIKQTGLLNYEQLWQNDEFPLTYFLLLKKNLIERGLWIPVSVQDNTLNDEIDLLLV